MGILQKIISRLEEIKTTAYCECKGCGQNHLFTDTKIAVDRHKKEFNRLHMEHNKKNIFQKLKEVLHLK